MLTLKQEKMNRTTAVIDVITDCGRMSIKCLLSTEEPLKICENTEWITFYKDVNQTQEIESWDNPRWLTKLNKHLYHRNYKKKQVEEFKNFCKENSLDFNDMEKLYITIFATAEKVGMFKKI
jgi:hypothetical protein